VKYIVLSVASIMRALGRKVAITIASDMLQ